MRNWAPPKQKKADVVKDQEAFHHVGLLLNEPPAKAGCPLASYPTIYSTDSAEAFRELLSQLNREYRIGEIESKRWSAEIQILCYRLAKACFCPHCADGRSSRLPV
jgi:hypothetical protein